LNDAEVFKIAKGLIIKYVYCKMEDVIPLLLCGEWCASTSPWQWNQGKSSPRNCFAYITINVFDEHTSIAVKKEEGLGNDDENGGRYL